MEEDLQWAFVSTNQQPAFFRRRLLGCVIPSLQNFDKADQPSEKWNYATKTEIGLMSCQKKGIWVEKTGTTMDGVWGTEDKRMKCLFYENLDTS